MEDDIRIEVWKFFLGIYPWDSSRVERDSILEAKKYVLIFVILIFFNLFKKIYFIEKNIWI